jgi:hypothetical protein
LEHNYPRSKAEPNVVSVDINALLEEVTAEALRVGTWLNVVGYVREIESVQPISSFSSTPEDVDRPNERPSTVSPRPVYIEAIMIFPAGAIALGEYERILRNSQDVERMVKLTN